MNIKQSTVTIGATILLLIMSILLGSSVFFLNSAITTERTAIDRQMEFMQLGISLADASDYLTDEARRYTVTGNRVHYDNYWREVNETKTRDHVIVRLVELDAPQEELDLIEEAKSNSDALIAIEEAAFDAVEAGDMARAQQLMFDDQYATNKAIIMEPIAEFQSLMNQRAANEVDDASQITRSALIILVILTIATPLVMGSVLWIFHTKVSVPINHYAEQINSRQSATNFRLKPEGTQELKLLGNAFNQMLNDLHLSMSSLVAKESLESVIAKYQAFVAKVAQGDLTSRLDIEVDDAEHMDDLNHLGQNLNVMVENLSQMALQIREVAGAVSASATEIQAATNQQSASATEQSAIVTQTVAVTESVRTIVEETADRANAVSTSSQESVDFSREGNLAVADSITGMEMIHQRVNAIAENILMLSERTQQIGEIIDSVSALAEQSKLLALNASIEASRAGEDGKGFAVVAMEVRELAEQSHKATARVRDILGEIQKATNTAVMVTEEGSKVAESGVSLVERAGEAIHALSETMERVAEAAVQIAASAGQQTNGMDQLVMAMSQINQASVQTASSAKQTEQSVNNLITISHQLEEAAERYRL